MVASPALKSLPKPTQKQRKPAYHLTPRTKAEVDAHLAPQSQDKHFAKVLTDRNKTALDEASNYAIVLMQRLRKTGAGHKPDQIDARIQSFRTLTDAMAKLFGWNATTNNTFALNVHMSEDTLDLITEQKTTEKPAEVVDVQSVASQDTPH